MRVTRRLRSEDQTELERFLVAHLETSLILLSNLAQAGIEGRGRFAGDYFGSFSGSELTAVAAHYWNDNLLVQGANGLDDVVRLVVDETARPVRGVMGPGDSVRAALEALNLTARPTAVSSMELLFTLDLEKLQVPRALAEGRWKCRRATRADRETFLAEWRADYNIEALGATDTQALRSEVREAITRDDAGPLWVLEVDAQPVSMTGFSAAARGVVHVGGVWTPPALRGRGYGRAVVAGSLLDRQARGARRSVLFTDAENIGAQRAYRALGYRHVGEYGLWLFS